MKNDKRLETLNALREKQAKALEVQTAAEKKTSEINAKIAKIENEIRAEELSKLDKICSAKGINITDVAAFLEKIDISLEDALSLIEKHKAEVKTDDRESKDTSPAKA